MNLKESEEGYMENLEEGKGGREGKGEVLQLPYNLKIKK